MNLGSVMFVGEAGMMSEKSLKVLEKSGYDWVVAARLRGISGEGRDRVSEHKKWEGIGEGKREKIYDTFSERYEAEVSLRG